MNGKFGNPGKVEMCGHKLRSVLVFLHYTYQWLWYFLFWIAIVTISCQTLKVSKWHTGIVFTLAGSPVKDWHDRGVEWVQRIFWGLKFWFEFGFFLVCELHRDFLGVAKIGWDFLWIFLSGAVLSINDFGTLVPNHTSTPPPPPTHPSQCSQQYM